MMMLMIRIQMRVSCSAMHLHNLLLEHNKWLPYFKHSRSRLLRLNNLHQPRKVCSAMMRRIKIQMKV